MIEKSEIGNRVRITYSLEDVCGCRAKRIERVMEFTITDENIDLVNSLVNSTSFVKLEHVKREEVI